MALSQAAVTPIPTCRCIVTHLQQATFENIVTKGEIDEQFSPLPQCFQQYLIIKLSFMEIHVNFHVFANMIFKSTAAELSYVGVG